ncbi:hypothetical protein GCM10022224_040330 [Nonomuraea antimicrobica]|uniref:Uncharacterized protein n=1 Tax=Nonomuraea antimicrobica TaxID=561173 RepID=A0ABP7BWS3_9ACTN
MNSRFAYIAAPLLVFAYGVLRIIDGLDGSRGPGFAWTAGHLAFMAALVLFAQIFWRLRAMAGRDALSTVSAVAGTVGVATLLAQFGIDVVVGFLAADHEGMGVLFDSVQSVPGVSIVVYSGGPVLFSLGLPALMVQLAVRRRVKAWMPVLVLLDVTLPFVDKDLIPLGALFLLISFVSLARQAPVGRHAVAVS